MSYAFILKYFLILVSVVMTAISLVKLSKKKTHFQIFPDSVKKDLFKRVRFMTILNILSVILIFVSYFIIHSSFFYIPILGSMLLCFHSLNALDEEFKDFIDDEKK